MKTVRLCIAACLALAALAAHSAAPAPSILITNFPPFGAQGNVSGLVLNANPATNSVAVYIFVAGNWYSKPGCADPLTTIRPDGSWTADITIFSSDTNATEIAAFLVPSNFTNACVSGAPGLPIPPQAAAVAYANRVDSAARQFDFAGYGWWVKSSTGLAGPGPNYFSDSTNNAWVDAQGALHLAITYVSNVWQCAEVISDRSFGYGQYRFTIYAPIASLDPNAVLGCFTWSYDAAYNYREIDIELSRWDYAFGPANLADYAIAPFGTGQTFRFPLPVTLTNSTHDFVWQSNRLSFQSWNGGFDTAPGGANILESWNYAVSAPPAGGEQVHLNLWLDNGNPPAGNQPVEVVIPQFDFVPLGSPPAAQLAPPVRLPGGGVLITAQGQPDWHYTMWGSANLSDWIDRGTILATNNFFQFTDTNPPSPAALFYRLTTNP